MYHKNHFWYAFNNKIVTIVLLASSGSAEIAFPHDEKLTMCCIGLPLQLHNVQKCKM